MVLVGLTGMFAQTGADHDENAAKLLSPGKVVVMVFLRRDCPISSRYAPVIQQMPFLAGEFGESVDGSACGTTNVDALMQWFDQHNAGYSAWSWDTWGACSGGLVSNYNGTPAQGDGQYIQSNYTSTYPANP